MMISLKWFGKNSQQPWNQQSITRQFKLASVTILGLVAGVTMTSLISLNLVRQKTELTLLASFELQQLIVKMNHALEKTYQLEQDFFQEILTLGVDRARQNHLNYHDQNVNQIQTISNQIQQLIEVQHLSQKIHHGHDDVLAYRQTIKAYHHEFKQADDLAEDLGSKNSSIIQENHKVVQLLHANIKWADNPEMMDLYHQLIATEKAYLLTREPLEKQKLNQVIDQLGQMIKQETYLTFDEQENAEKYLSLSQSNFEKISILEAEIRQISDRFREESERVSNQLLSLSNEEVQLAYQEIQRTTQHMTLILAGSVVAMITLSSIIWRSFQSALKQLEIEQEKSERLLLNILPESIAQRLKYQPGTIADNFEEATVLFADIAGFTQLSTQISPTELVNLLNEIFSAFDQITTEKNLEKIKTIGDAYLVVGGLPIPRSDHAEAIAELALEMQRVITEFNQKYHYNLQLRIGINTGPVVAGVIGAKKFIYDLWGDTVNTASRMESHGIVGKIQVTEATYQRLQHQYEFEGRGLMTIKGKGQMNTYLLKGKATECLQFIA